MTQPQYHPPRNQHWWQQCQLKSYDAALAFFKTARNPAKGKPLMSWARMYMRGENLHVYMQSDKGVEIGFYSPDNKFTFTSSPHLLRQTCAVTLSQAMYRAIPFMWQRVGVGRYRVQHVDRLHADSKGYWLDWKLMRSVAPEYFAGIQFDLTTQRCINPAADITKSVVPENRKAWLSSLRKFKYGIKARARVGVFVPIAADVSKDTMRKIPDWSHDDWMNLLYTSIKQNEFPLELMRGIVSSAIHNRTWMRRNAPFTVEEVMATVDALCNTYSVDLRRKFGVFDAMPDMQGANALS